MQATIIIAVLALAAWIGMTLLLIRTFVVVVPAHRVGVMSGRRHIGPDGSAIGFRIVSGRTIRLPIIEQLDLLPELPESVPVRASDVLFADDERGALALHVTIAYAPGADRYHAVERFLGQSTETVQRVAADVFESALRTVATNVRRAEVDAAPTKLAALVEETATDDLRKLGLAVATLSPSSPASDTLAFEQRLREAGLLDIATLTELATDVATDRQPVIDDSLLAAAGTPEVSVDNGRLSLRWATARVDEERLLAGARLLARARTGSAAYR